MTNRDGMPPAKCLCFVIPSDHCDQLNVTLIFRWRDDEELKQASFIMGDCGGSE